MTAGLPTVGLRMPAHPLALELIRAAGRADRRAQRESLHGTLADHARSTCRRRRCADYVLDGGPARVGIESTVLSLVGRADAAAAGHDSAAGNRGAHRAGAAAGGARGASPVSRHACAALPAEDATVPAGQGRCRAARSRRGLRPGREMPSNPREYGTALYEALHRLDRRGLDWIAVERPPDTPEWAGIRDRLKRAAVIAQSSRLIPQPRGRGGLERVAEAADRMNQHRIGRVALHLLAQPQDVDVHRAVGDGAVLAPHGVQQLLAAEDHARPAHQEFEQAELGGGERQRRRRSGAPGNWCDPVRAPPTSSTRDGSWPGCGTAS